MSSITHQFGLEIDATEHHLISTSPALIITSKGTPGEKNVYMASKWGANNHVDGFVSGEDTIKIPLATIQELNASTALTVGTLPAASFESSATDPATADTIHYNTATGVLSYFDGTDATALLTLDGSPAPTVAADDIEIV